LKKKQLIKEALLATILMIVLDLVINLFSFKSEFIRPIRQGLNGFDVYDLRFSQDDSVVNAIDTGITIVEIGNSRAEIAGQIIVLAEYEPKLIGIDAIFSDPHPAGMDDTLINALHLGNKMVVASKYQLNDQTGKPEILQSFFNSSIPSLQNGFFNLLGGAEEVKRQFVPFIKMGDTLYPAFTTAMLRQISPEKYLLVKNRNASVESINYSGGTHHYNIITKERLSQSDHSADMRDLVHNKIVFLGMIKDGVPDVLEDNHFTPLNHKVVGKSFPDMYGVVIHANIFEMMLRGNYIFEAPSWVVYFITFIIVFLINIFFIRHLSKGKKQSHLFLFLFQFIIAAALVYLALLAFKWFDFKMNLAPMMVAIVLSFEVFWIYEWTATFLRKRFRYETFVHK
jgi:CHASE2 domain-containing sensor protein